MLERFPRWEDRAEYWTVGDIDVAPPLVALTAVDGRIDELVERLANCVLDCALTVMAPAAEEKAFLRSAVAAIPRIAEIVRAFPPEDRAGALETAERRLMETALEFGCTEIAARSRVSAVMGRLRRRLEEQRTSEKKLLALLHRLTESD